MPEGTATEAPAPSRVLNRLGVLLEEAALHHMQRVPEQAEAIGIHEHTLYRAKFGRGKISRAAFEKIALYLGYDALKLHRHIHFNEPLS